MSVSERKTQPGFRMDEKAWPHGGNAKGVPHGAGFSAARAGSRRCSFTRRWRKLSRELCPEHT